MATPNETEQNFIKNYFDHSEYIYHPRFIRLKNGLKYTPDFYDFRRRAFIEVVGSRQAYHQNKEKYKQFKNDFPELNLELRDPKGDIFVSNGKSLKKKLETQKYYEALKATAEESKSKNYEEITQQTCNKCGYQWYPKKPQLPKICPRCKYKWWQHGKPQPNRKD